ncbi:hypothetical protein EDD32_2276 [Georgenia muralis]|uniref:Ribosomally synthesized peptide with SipW-like signal peptide n=1 Tax=Georgenia muralis TaxID=154117 RepID=A0A3N4ZQ98_9MICO|nr:hypothetical protein EDD32_2276 [Georgenia muralis]
MRRHKSIVITATAGTLALLLVVGVSGAYASGATGDEGLAPKTEVIGGREYGSEDGLVVDVEQFAIVPGGDPVGRYFGTTVSPGQITPMVQWGTSYAISTEVVQLRYDGKARAAGNIYSGLRIINVCFWYSRGGTNVSSEKCSSARLSGTTWSAGPEVTHSVWDSLNPGAEQTVFNIRTTRIDPGVT